MYVSVGIFEIRVPDSRSLKAKRSVVRSVRDRLRQKLSVSVAEVGGLDSWKVARLGVTFVSSSRETAAARMEKCALAIEAETGGNLTGWSSEVVEFDEETDLKLSADHRLLEELQGEFLDGD